MRRSGHGLRGESTDYTDYTDYYVIKKQQITLMTLIIRDIRVIRC